MLANPFIAKYKTNTLERHTVQGIFGTRKTLGKVGLEVEVEGNGFPKSYDEEEEGCDDAELIPPQWRYTHDGSLRGFDNAEYVLTRPLEFEDVPKAIDDLWVMFKNYGSKLDESNRTSVHVHLNVQEFRLNRLCAFAGLWFCVEDLLVRWCGDHRVGNMFCLRASDAPVIVSKLRKLVTNGDSRGSTNDDGLHYAGFNTQSLSKFGSIEIRTLRGATDPEVIKTWVSILERIYYLSEDFENDPRTVCQMFSGQHYRDFVRQILGPYTGTVLDSLDMDEDEIRRSVHQGVRIAQNICFCSTWEEYRQTPESKPDPFGRDYVVISEAAEVKPIDLPQPFQSNSIELAMAGVDVAPAPVVFDTHMTYQDYYDLITLPSPTPVSESIQWLNEEQTSW